MPVTLSLIHISHVKAAIRGDRRFDPADFGVAPEHGVAKTPAVGQIKPGERDGVIHQHGQQRAGRDDRPAPEGGIAGLLVEVAFVVMDQISG